MTLHNGHTKAQQNMREVNWRRLRHGTMESRDHVTMESWDHAISALLRRIRASI